MRTLELQILGPQEGPRPVFRVTTTKYDQRGRIVFTASKGLPGVGFPRNEWSEIQELESSIEIRQINCTTHQNSENVNDTSAWEFMICSKCIGILWLL